MRFMLMHKQPAAEEASRPTPEFIASMGNLIGDAAKAGAFQGGEGLKSSRYRVRLNYKDSQRTLEHGPYEGRDELVGGFALVKVKSLDEAVDWTTRYLQIMGDGEVEIGELCEPWDLGMMPKPEGDIGTRYLLLHKATQASESDADPGPEVISQMGALIAEMKAAGILVTTEALRPSSEAVRVTYRNGKRASTVDGPFAESKELIGGFSMFQVESLDEALRWTDRFGSLFPEVEVDIRPL